MKTGPEAEGRWWVPFSLDRVPLPAYRGDPRRSLTTYTQLLAIYDEPGEDEEEEEGEAAEDEGLADIDEFDEDLRIPPDSAFAQFEVGEAVPVDSRVRRR